jgi:hypothetical protein
MPPRSPLARAPLALLLLLSACEPWNLPGNGYTSLDQALWDPAVVSAADGVYVRLPQAGQLVRITPDGASAAVDLNGAAPGRLVLAPDDETVLTFGSWPVCNDDDPRVVYVDDCNDDDLSTASELEIVRDGALVKSVDVPNQYNAFAFNDDGTLAVAYLDFSADTSVAIDGVLNLTSAIFVDITTGEIHAVPVGFAAENVLFSPDGTKALVLSRSEVALVALTGDDAWTVRVTYPLTLDVDQEVSPQDAVLITNDAGDTDYALVSVAGDSELYVLDLTYESIDIVELDGVPSDLFVDDVTNHTLVVYGNRAQLDVLDHELFEVQSYDLDEPCTKIAGGDGHVVLYDDAGRYHDVYLFDTAAGTLTEERAENPIMEMRLTADQAWGVATMTAEPTGGSNASGFFDQYYGLGVFDLTGAADPLALVLEGEPVGLELTVNDGKDYALALMDGVDGLQKIDLAAATNSEILLEEPAVGIDAMPNGLFVVTHPSPLGLVTFVDASTASLTTAAGFATTGLLDRPILPRRTEEN